jgi:hypothetical protein
MHGLKSTNHPGLYKPGKFFWCKILGKRQYRERSPKTSSETEAFTDFIFYFSWQPYYWDSRND